MSSPSGEGPAVTVIVPAYNAAKTIETTLRTILEQTAKLECIVVDDCSADDTAAMVERIADADSRVIVVRQPVNAGVSEARNRALALARGTWITFVDADDRLRPGALSALLDAGAREDARVIVGQRISTDGDRWWFPKLYEKPDIREPGLKAIATHPGLLYYLGPPGKLYHRSVIGGPGFEGRMLGDQPWVLRAFLRAGNRISVIDDVVYEWWRPRTADDAETITSARTHSAKLGVEAVRMAEQAYAIADEAFAGTFDQDTRTRLSALYFERLVRSELGAQYRNALATVDPDLPAMSEALAHLLEAVPADEVRGNGAVREELVSPLTRAWDQLAPAAVPASWDLLLTAVRIDPRIPAGLSGQWYRIALATRHLPGAGRPLCQWLLRRLARGRRALRPG